MSCKDPAAECQHGMKCMHAQTCLQGYVDAPPTCWEDLMKRQAMNIDITGQYMDTRINMACPACGAADFMSTLLLESEQVFSAGAVCKECERGFRFPVKVIRCEHGEAVGKEIGLVQ